MPSLLGLNQASGQNKLTLPQQQFQGQQAKLQQDDHIPPSQFNFSQLPGTSGGALQMKLQGGGGLGVPANPNNPDNYVNKLSDIHQILKPTGPAPGAPLAQPGLP